MLSRVVPDDSPTFVHGRPEVVSFDVVFNKRPFSKHHDPKTQETDHLNGAFKLKAVTVSLSDGVRTVIQLSPISIHSTKKQYRDDEYHVSCVFSLSEY